MNINLNFPLMFILSIIILVSLYKIENNVDCKCSDNENKKFLKEWFIFYICYNIFITIIFLFYDISYYMIFFIVHFIIIQSISLVMIVRLFLYMRFLKNNCKCAYGGKEKFLYWFYLIYFCLILLAIVILLMIAFGLSFKFF